MDIFRHDNPLKIHRFNISCPTCGEIRQFATTSNINQTIIMECSKHGKYRVNIYPQAEKEKDRVVYLK